MPSVESQTTMQLIATIDSGVLSSPQQAAVTELIYREIKENDADDQENLRGGIRPHHAPIV